MEIKSLERGETFLNQTTGLLKIQHGRVWLTIAGDQKDYVLKAGDCIRLEAHQSALLQGLEGALLLFNFEEQAHTA